MQIGVTECSHSKHPAVWWKNHACKTRQNKVLKMVQIQEAEVKTINSCGILSWQKVGFERKRTRSSSRGLVKGVKAQYRTKAVDPFTTARIKVRWEWNGWSWNSKIHSEIYWEISSRICTSSIGILCPVWDSYLPYRSAWFRVSVLLPTQLPADGYPGK